MMSYTFGAFGQTSLEYTAVAKLRRALRAYADDTGNMLYNPGSPGGHYGQNTHAALSRVCRDLLGWESGPGCFSICATQRLRAKSACAECIAAALPGLVTQLPGLSLNDAEMADIVRAYGEWLDAYVAEYGDGDTLDPAQIARREEVSIPEGERLAAERRAEADRLAAAEAAAAAAAEAARLAAAEAAAAAAAEAARLAAAAAAAGAAQRAGFSWWWVVLFVGLGGGLLYAAYGGKGEKEPKKLPRGRGKRTGREAWDFGGV